MYHFMTSEIQKLITVLSLMKEDQLFLKTLEEVTNHCVRILRKGKKILFVGNGGSAADAQHLAAELVSRLQFDRPGLSGIALTTDTSALTAIGNDYAFEKIFSRQVEAIGQPDDVLIAISTSGRSANVLRALEVARAKKMTTVGFSGLQSPLMQERCDFLVNIPSTDTQKIQEGHIVVGHLICSLIEEIMYGNPYNQRVKCALLQEN